MGATAVWNGAVGSSHDVPELSSRTEVRLSGHDALELVNDQNKIRGIGGD